MIREWARIGATSFGGPPSQVALLRELCVDRRAWLDGREFEDANAATQLLPGPGGTQLAIYCAARVGGGWGAALGGLAFMLPGLLIILAISALAFGSSPPLWIRGLGAGAAAAVVAVVGQAGLVLGRSSLAGRHGRLLVRSVVYMALGAAAAVAVGPFVVLVLAACGAFELGILLGLGVHAWPLLAVASSLPALAWTALKVGALSYGGGFVIIPLMQGDAVDTHHWMTAAEFANAVAYGQLTPGPVVHTVAIVGWAADGLGGALLATAVAFAPSFLAIALLGRRFVQLRRSVPARAFLDGAGPAAVGAILGAVVPLLGALEEGWQYAVLAGAVIVLVLGRSAFVALVGAGVVGVVVALAGGAVP